MASMTTQDGYDWPNGQHDERCWPAEPYVDERGCIVIPPMWTGRLAWGHLQPAMDKPPGRRFTWAEAIYGADLRPSDWSPEAVRLINP